MRNGQNNNKRMRNRNNSHNNNNNRRSHNPMTRAYDSNGPDIKIRGTASHIAEKYLQLARDSQSSGDPVAAENYYQHAEHYFRLIAAAQEQFRQNQPQQQPRIDQEIRDESGDEGEESFSNFGAEPGFVPHTPQPSYLPREAPPYQQREQQREQPYRGHHTQPQSPIQNGETGDVDRLPSFITGAQSQLANGMNDFEGNGGRQGGERFQPRRRRRPHNPRPEGRRSHRSQNEEFSPGE